MSQNISRRHFLGTSAAVTAGVFAASQTSFPTASAQVAGSTEKYKTRLYKALIAGAPTDEICENWKNAGFAGMEATGWKEISVADARKNRLIAEKHDFHVHSVMRGWAEFNHKDESVAQKTIDETKHAIRIASAYGAETILLVPCRVGGMKMPEPWDFEIDFDSKTLMVKTVAAGDNSQYAEYIKAQNDSTVATIKAMEQLIPVAAEEGVMIALENVWNDLWSTPEIAAALVNYFDNPWVKAYFDLGNHTKYSKPQLWIEALGRTLVKLHIKGYKVSEFLGKRGGGKGDWCPTDQSSTDWKEVRALLDKYNYNGWITVEEGNYPPEKYSKILDDFIAG